MNRKESETASAEVIVDIKEMCYSSGDGCI